jgi:hypothetical protein
MESTRLTFIHGLAAINSGDLNLYSVNFEQHYIDFEYVVELLCVIHLHFSLSLSRSHSGEAIVSSTLLNPDRSVHLTRSPIPQTNRMQLVEDQTIPADKHAEELIDTLLNRYAIPIQSPIMFLLLARCPEVDVVPVGSCLFCSGHSGLFLIVLIFDTSSSAQVSKASSPHVPR